MWEKVKAFFLEVYYFLTSRVFWVNFGKIGALVALGTSLIFWWMTCYTRHGDVMKVENLVGKNMKEASRIADDLDFKIIVTDSIYREGQPADIILEQNPSPNSYVKEGRTIYVKITKAAGDLVTLPDIAGRDNISFYSKLLESQGIKVGKVDTVEDAQLIDGTILQVLIRGRDVYRDLPQGVRVPQGSFVDFVIAKREKESSLVPDVMCRTADEASLFLDAAQLKLGDIKADADVVNQNTAYVYKTEPAIGTEIKKGESVTIFVAQKKPAECPSEE